MNKPTTIILILLFLFLFTAGEAIADVSCEEVNIDFSGGQRTVKLVRADLNDKTIRIEAAIANNQIGRADNLCNIAQQLASPDREVIAAINGSYFSAYDGYPVPWNTIEKQGEFVHMGNMGSVIGFSGDNHVFVEDLYISIKGSTNDNWVWPDNWYAWGFNHMRDEAEAVVIFTPAYGKTTGAHNKTSVVVDKGIIVDIHSGEAIIPVSGYTIMVGDPGILDRFKIGKTIDYRVEFNHLEPNTLQPGQPVAWDHIRTTLGAGPTVLKNGAVTADAKAEGFWEDKIVTSRYQRSFAGVTAGNILIIGTVSNVTVKELGEIAQNLNCINAISLDSGASSSLYYQGRYITKPLRQLSNALVITRLKTPPVRLMVNGKELFSDTDPVIKDGRTLVPMRKIFEEMNIIPEYDPQDMSIVAIKGNTFLKLKINSNVAEVNNIAQQLDVPAMLINNRTFVPVRFITEVFKGVVAWDAGQNMVKLDL